MAPGVSGPWVQSTGAADAEDAEGVYMGMSDVVAVRSFPRNLLSVGRARNGHCTTCSPQYQKYWVSNVDNLELVKGATDKECHEVASQFPPPSPHQCDNESSPPLPSRGRPIVPPVPGSSVGIMLFAAAVMLIKVANNLRATTWQHSGYSKPSYQARVKGVDRHDTLGMSISEGPGCRPP